MKVDHSVMRLGALPPAHSGNYLHLADYLTSERIEIPKDLDNLAQIPTLGMMGNDQNGDCTMAAMGHFEQLVSFLAGGSEVTVSDKDILDAYYKLTGGQDTGLQLETVIAFMESDGLAGHKISGKAAIEPDNDYLHKLAIYLFGAAYKALALPISAQKQRVWQVSRSHDGKPGSWGGHCVIDGAYDGNFLTCVTWGMLKKQTYGFEHKYGVEKFALLSPEWIAKGKTLAPNGLNWDQLEADLADLS